MLDVAHLIRANPNALDNQTSSGALSTESFLFLSVWTDMSRSFSLGWRSGVHLGMATCFLLEIPCRKRLVGEGSDGSCM